MPQTLAEKSKHNHTEELDEPEAASLLHELTADAPGVATFASLMAKPRRTMTFTVMVAGADDEPVSVSMKYKALSAKEYDDLVAAHPPSSRERSNGAVFNVDTFGPALIAAVSVTPALTYEQAEALWKNPDWSNGETTALFINAQRVCNSGIDVPFNERG